MSEKISITSILVVDDDDFQLKLMAHILDQLGYTRVSTCNNGAIAMQRIDTPERIPDIILLDLNMPEMDGIEFIRKLVEHRFSGSLILMSGENERILQAAENLVRIHQLRLLGRVEKPVDSMLLARLLEQHKLLSEKTPQATRTTYSADDLRAAITNGEFVNYYQPKVALDSGKLVGVESLVRWRHSQSGMVFPDQFISVAEDNGLIDDLTRLVLTNALAQASNWKKDGLVLQVAVNISMDNLTSLDFPDMVAKLTAAAGIPPQTVILEVTESRLLRDTRAAFDILTRLRLKRFGLSIDDFGTGYSSLAQLRDLPFDELKVDRSFVHGAWNNHTIRAIFDASLGLARQLGMKIVAEGVEDIDDWQFLKASGCDLAQGYFIAKPMPAADLPGWIEQWETKLN